MCKVCVPGVRACVLVRMVCVHFLTLTRAMKWWFYTFGITCGCSRLKGC